MNRLNTHCLSLSQLLPDSSERLLEFSFHSSHKGYLLLQLIQFVPNRVLVTRWHLGLEFIKPGPEKLDGNRVVIGSGHGGWRRRH